MSDDMRCHDTVTGRSLPMLSPCTGPTGSARPPSRPSVEKSGALPQKLIVADSLDLIDDVDRADVCESSGMSTNRS